MQIMTMRSGRLYVRLRHLVLEYVTAIKFMHSKTNKRSLSAACLRMKMFNCPVIWRASCVCDFNNYNDPKLKQKVPAKCLLEKFINKKLNSMKLRLLHSTFNSTVLYLLNLIPLISIWHFMVSNLAVSLSIYPPHYICVLVLQ